MKKFTKKPLDEMTRVGKFDESGNTTKQGNFDLRIYPEPSVIPSFHLRYKNDWEYVIDIATFNILEVKPPNKLNLNKGDQLPKSVLKALLKFLNSTRLGRQEVSVYLSPLDS